MPWDLDYELHGPASSRFQAYYNPVTPTGYIGHLSDFSKYVERKGLFGSIFGIFRKHVRFSSLINALAALPIVNSKTADEFNNDVGLVIEEFGGPKTLAGWLDGEQKRATKQGRCFTSVSKSHYLPKNHFYGAIKRFGGLDSRFVLITGCLCDKEHLKHNGTLFQMASQSSCEWVLCDFPPAAMQNGNPDYKGELVFVELDDQFRAAFDGRVPFDKEIGWFPYCTLAGFLSTSRLTSEHFATLRLCLLTHRRPISPEPHINKIARELAIESKNPIYLRTLGSRILIYYLIPSMYKAWGIDYEQLDPGVRAPLATLFANDRADLNPHLVSFYDANILN